MFEMLCGGRTDCNRAHLAPNLCAQMASAKGFTECRTYVLASNTTAVAARRDDSPRSPASARAGLGRQAPATANVLFLGKDRFREGRSGSLRRSRIPS